MSPKAKKELNRLEDSSPAPRRKSSTLAQATKRAAQRGEKWIIVGSIFYHIVNGRAVKG